MENHVLIIGATSLIAENCLIAWHTKYHVNKFTLVSRDKDKISRLTKNLLIKFPALKIKCITANFCDFKKINKIIDGISKDKKNFPNRILIAYGTMPDQKKAQDNIQIINETFIVNSLSVIIWLESLVNKFKNSHLKIGVITSVAGDRSRKSNYIYGSSKSLISSYLEGMQHRFYKTKINIMDIKPGPTETPMTSNLLNNKLNFAPVNKVSLVIVNGIEKNKGIIYAPKKWFYIMLIIKIIPKFIFMRLKI